MNYLAHILLSGSDGGVRVGNFIGDAVKGNAYKDYPQAICRGVKLHRTIDAYTDSHPAIREAVRTLSPHFGRYSGVVLDIYFDHLLASRFGEFSDVPLRRFTRRFYLDLALRRHRLPQRIKNFMWHFILTDRLGRYATAGGIGESLSIMVRYRHLDIHVQAAVEYLARHEDELWEVFLPFFGELQALCRRELSK